MRVLFTHHRYHSNLFNWFRGFQNQGHEVRVLLYKPEKSNQPDLPAPDYLPPSKRSHRLMIKHPKKRGDGVDQFSKYYFPSWISLYKYFKEFRPDMVSIKPPLTHFALMVAFLGKLFRARVVFHSQTRIHKPYSTFRLWVYRFGLGLLNAYWMSPSQGDKTRFSKVPKRMLWVPFAMNSHYPKGRSYFMQDKVNLLSVAKYVGSKNPKLVMRAFFRLCLNHEDIRLTICGTGDEQGEYYEEMVEQVKKSGFEDRIDLLINKSYVEVQELYRQHDVFILPSNYDPASITNLEAMSFGLPVICSTANGTAEYIEHGYNGFLLEPEDEEGLYQFLNELIPDRKRIETMGNRILNSVAENHNGEKITNGLLKRVGLL